MCQQEILNYLNKKRKPILMKDLCLVIPANRQNISRACSGMVKRKELTKKKIRDGNFIKFLYAVR
jgi:hypothetical protein